jgi:hypothetical protein
MRLETGARALHVRASRWLPVKADAFDEFHRVTPFGLNPTHEIKSGAYTFRCGKDALFVGTLEVVYQMRSTLFHGELVPTKDPVACYEPAFRIVRRFLECVT